MSMEIHVLLSKSRLPSVREWQAAIDGLKFNVKIDPSWKVKTDTGFLPAKFKGHESGFEFDICPASDIIETYPKLKAQFAGRNRSANFRWGGDLPEMACAMVASAALAQLSDGIWFDPQKGECFDPAAAIKQAKAGVAAAKRKQSPAKRRQRRQPPLKFQIYLA